MTARPTADLNNLARAVTRYDGRSGWWVTLPPAGVGSASTTHASANLELGPRR